MINLFGNGFIGSYFSNSYKCIINDRDDLIPKLNGVSDILYFISTIDNYNVKTNPYLDIETNLTTLIRVLENFRKNPLSKDIVFNFVSSWFVYGQTAPPAKETDNCNPTGFYSITKRTAEQLLISYCETYNLKYRILRLANVLGVGDKKVSRKKNATTWIIQEMKKNKPVEVYDGGDTIRDFIHVKDICRAIKLILESGEINTIYNVGNGIPIKLVDIINYVKYIGSTSEVINIPQSDFHKIVQIKSMYLDISKLKKLGYNPEKDIYATVKELYDNA